MSERCVYFACAEREPENIRTHVWWRDYGACSRDHAFSHYGTDAIDSIWVTAHDELEDGR